VVRFHLFRNATQFFYTTTRCSMAHRYYPREYARFVGWLTAYTFGVAAVACIAYMLTH
jgi:hypothetical protein